jgi:hypothetical protein
VRSASQRRDAGDEWAQRSRTTQPANGRMRDDEPDRAVHRQRVESPIRPGGDRSRADDVASRCENIATRERTVSRRDADATEAQLPGGAVTAWAWSWRSACPNGMSVAGARPEVRDLRLQRSRAKTRTLHRDPDRLREAGLRRQSGGVGAILSQHSAHRRLGPACAEPKVLRTSRLPPRSHYVLMLHRSAALIRQ